MRGRSTQGLTLIEMLVALLLLGIILAGVCAALLSQTSLNTQTEKRSQAAVAIRTVLDEARTQDPALMPVGGTGPGQDVTVGGRSYRVLLDYCVQAEYCTQSARSLRARAVLDGQAVLSVETVFTRVNADVTSGE